MKNRRLIVTLLTIVIFTIGAMVLVNNQITSSNKIIFNKEMETIQLKKPIIDTKNELLLALSKRQSQRNISGKAVSPEILSEVLWAATGINRESGGHTAPLLWNVKIHVAMESGIYFYDPKADLLTKTLSKDIRNKMTYQDFAHKAPAILILSLDESEMTENWINETGGKNFYAGSMVSYVSQNIYLYCAHKDLATVAMGWIDHDFINEKLGFSETEHTYLVHPIGYPEKESTEEIQ